MIVFSALTLSVLGPTVPALKELKQIILSVDQ